MCSQLNLLADIVVLGLFSEWSLLLVQSMPILLLPMHPPWMFRLLTRLKLVMRHKWLLHRQLIQVELALMS